MKINDICINRNKSNSCKNLNVKKCTEKLCSFAQTKEQAEASRENAFKRLASLDIEKQYKIAVKYYDCKMPWLKGSVKNEG